MTIEKVIVTAQSLFETLSHTHTRGVVHRGVKPENIFYGLDGRAKLSDFDSAHVDDVVELTTSTLFSTSSVYAALPHIRLLG
jgi:eukaryotic-like serine/threonine-protein kinase